MRVLVVMVLVEHPCADGFLHRCIGEAMVDENLRQYARATVLQACRRCPSTSARVLGHRATDKACQTTLVPLQPSARKLTSGLWTAVHHPRLLQPLLVLAGPPGVVRRPRHRRQWAAGGITWTALLRHQGDPAASVRLRGVQPCPPLVTPCLGGNVTKWLG